MIKRPSLLVLAMVIAGTASVAAQGTPPVAPADALRRSLPPEEAFSHGLMPLQSTGIPKFAAAHPTWDGRGVLIAILDSGIDPGVPGLGITTTGQPKILDLRDFSHEGRVDLHPVTRHGDTLIVGTRRLLGASRVATAGAGEVWGGALTELPMGAAPAADFDGSGIVGDTLPVVVVRSASGWVLFADTQGNGTFADDHPIADFAVNREYFGWSRTNRAPSVNVAVNLADSSGVPTLDLFFDNGSHGTHVTGIAAGHDLYGVKGFDGVAPGAQVIGLKISNDAQGGITVSGSMIKALEYAIKFAHDRGFPLVVNMSFGVGNEIEGAAKIDALMDSVLAAHPDVVMTVAAGNDGPAFSTLGFPGSASRVIAVGATVPLVFSGSSPGDTMPEPIAPFSSRGAEFAGPDIVVPGVAYSTIPNFAMGQEQENGTSMAAPHAAGLAARLVSALKAGNRTASANEIEQALKMGARMLPSGGTLDQGAGEPDLSKAWSWLASPHEVPFLAVEVGEVHGRAGVYLTDDAASDPNRTARVSVTLRELGARAPLTVKLLPSAPWIHAPETVAFADGRAVVAVTVEENGSNRTGAIQVMAADLALGPLAIIPVTVRAPSVAAGSDTVKVVAGGVGRVFVRSDTGRGFQVEVAMLNAADKGTASLQEPGGMPFRDQPSAPAGAGDAAAMFDISGNDVAGGLYEVDVAAGPSFGITGLVTVRRAPVRLGASWSRDTLHVTAASLVTGAVSLRFRAGLMGAQRIISVRRTDDTPVRIALPVPTWAAHVAVDARMPREQWSRFTDFGLTYQDRSGRQLDASPINYAFSRSSPDLPPRLAGDSLILLLAPAFATPAADGPWTMELSVSFYVDKPVGLDNGGSALRTVAAGATHDEAFATSPNPLPLPPDFAPLVIVLALEGESHVWTREVRVMPAGAGH